MKYNGIEDIRLEHNLTKKSIVFEVGGWKGLFSSAISQEFDCYIYIFEPLKNQYNYLVEKYKNNNKIKVLNFGLEDTNETKKINLLEDGSSFYISESNLYEEVQVKNINEVIKELNINHIDLMELNCEGSEYRIIEALSNESIIMIDKIQIQFHNIPTENLEILKNNAQNKLSQTHEKQWGYSWFECWRIKK